MGAKATEEIEDEEMPLKAKGKSRGRPKGAVIKDTPKPTPTKAPEVAVPISQTTPIPSKKEAVFFKGEHLAVRNAEGSFYLCQASQNIYRHSRKIKIQWLGLTTENNPDKDLYIPEYYDTTEFETILTSVELEKKDKKMFKLEESENQRINKILQKAVDKETGKLSEDESLTEDNPDGLDISIYKDEDQLKELERKKKIEERKAAKKAKTPTKPVVKKAKSKPAAKTKKAAKKAKTPTKPVAKKAPKKLARKPGSAAKKATAPAPAKKEAGKAKKSQ